MGGNTLNKLREQLAETQAKELDINVFLEEYATTSIKLGTDNLEQSNLLQSMQKLMQYKEEGGIDRLTRQTTQIGSAIANANDVAEKMTREVRKLGKVQERLKACVERSDGMMRIRQSMQRLKASMNEKNYKDAATCLKELREIEAMRIPLDVSDSLRMNNAESDIRYAIESQMEAALRNKDEQTILRIGSIFEPMQFAEEGLQIILKFLSEQLNVHLTGITGSPNAIWSVQELSSQLIQVFNSVAESIQRYEPVMAQSFKTVRGPERMLEAVYSLGTPYSVRILSAYVKQRGLQELLAKAKASTKPTITSTSGTAPLSPTMQQQNAIKEDLDLNPYLNELTMVIQHSQTYERFVRGRQVAYLATSPPTSPKNGKNQLKNSLLPSYNASGLNQSVQDLAGYYCSLEEQCLVSATKKAIALEELRSVVMEEQLIPVSSIVDEVFYVARISGTRSIASGHVDSACGVLNVLATILNSSLGDLFCQRVQLAQKDTQGSALGMLTNLNPKQLRDQVQQIQATLGKKVPSATPPTSNSKTTTSPTMIIAPPVTLNSLDAVVQYLSQLQTQFEADIGAAFPDQPARMTSSLLALEDAASEFKALLLTCHDTVCQSFQPKLTASTTLLFKKITYELTDAQFTANEANDPFVFGLLQTLKTIVMPYESHLSKANYIQLMEGVADLIVDMIESMIVTKTFNVLGAMQFEREFRVLNGYFAEKCQQSKRFNATFAVLRQSALVLSVDSPGDVLEFAGRPTKGIEWKLSKQRVTELLHLRAEFSTANVNGVKW